MSDPLWRDNRPSRPYGSEPGARPPGRDTRMSADGPRNPADGPRNPVGSPRPPADGPRNPVGSPRPPADGPRNPAGGPQAPRPGGPGAPRRDPGSPGRDPGQNGRYPARVDPRGRDPRLGSREPGGLGPDGNRRDPGNFAPRGSDPAMGAQTRRMPPLPDATQATPRPGDTRPAMRSQAGTQRATAPGGRGRPEAQRRAESQRGLETRAAGRVRAAGTVGIAAGRPRRLPHRRQHGDRRDRHHGHRERAPGFLLGAFVVIGTVAAALAVRPRAGRMIFPVPVLCYLVAALLTGVIYNHSADSSKTALAIGAAQWVASGFFAMAVATILGRRADHRPLVPLAPPPGRRTRLRAAGSARRGPGAPAPGGPGDLRRTPRYPSYTGPGRAR